MMRKLKTSMQTVILIVILFLLVSPMLIAYAGEKENIIEQKNIITIEERYNCNDLMFVAGVDNVLSESGTSDLMPMKSITNREFQEPKTTNIGKYKLTAYCSCQKCCGEWSAFNKTASGTTPQQGRTIACNSLDFGTEVIINDNTYIVEDTGNMKNNVIDIYFNSHEEALIFGVQYADVYIVNE